MARPHARYGASGGFGPPQGRDYVSPSPFLDQADK